MRFGGARAVRLRTWLSVALAVAAVLAALLGVTCLYARSQLLSARPFADRTVSALARPTVRRVVAREIVTQIVERAEPDLLAARPLLTTAVEAAVGTRQFTGVVHALAIQAHQVLFDRGGNVVFTVADAGEVAISALRSLAPGVAAKIPAGADAKLLELRRRSFTVRTLRVADDVRELGVVLPPVALALFAVALLLAPRRRLLVTVTGLGLAIGGLALLVDAGLLRHAVLSKLFGAEELSDGEVRAAAGALWDAYVGGFSSWMVGVAVVGIALAGIASGLLRPGTAARAAPALARRVESAVGARAARGLAGAVAVLGGCLLVLRPTLAVEVLAVIAGAVLASIGLGELLAALGLRPPERAASERAVAGALLSGAGVLAVLVAGPAAAIAVRSPPASHPPALSDTLTCNGYKQLCSRRLDEVVFAGTHNSMSASESPGWLIANQRHGVARQLDDGIRAFKISTHYGIGTSPRDVQTDIAAEGHRLNRVSEQLTAQARQALQRLTGSLGFGRRGKGKQAVWLCHTLCELGATSMASFLGTVRRFLDKNPGQVLVFFDEDYVSEGSLEREFERAGLLSHLAAFRPGEQLPTLGEMVRSQRNIAVFAQEPVLDDHPWDMYAFGSWIQDTPLGAVKPSQFTCAPYRGESANPLLMMNDWADVFPPRRSPNLPLLKRSFIVERARRCERERHRLPNLILTDFYESGDLLGAVRELNGLGDEKPAPIVPVRG